ncbi:MAG: F0F1 ATP synthase subunit A [Candidatus Eiseniibacteriota bacterium]
MGFEFLVRTMRATAVFTCVVAALAALRTGDAMFGLAVLAGSAWSLASFWLLKEIVRLIQPNGRSSSPLRSLLLFGVKGPLLYMAGYGLLVSGLPGFGLLIGFSLLFVVVTMKALGLMLTGRLRTNGAGRGLTRGAGLAIAGLALLGTLASAQEHAAPTAAPAKDPHATEAPRGEAAHGGEAHAEGGHASHPELPNVITFLRAAYQGKEQPAWLTFLHTWENAVFSALGALIVLLVFGLAARPRAIRPGPLQNFAELVLGGLHDFFLGILGPQGKPYVPFIGSLFLYIVATNWMGMIPFLKSPNVSLNSTVALALCVFVYVQWIGISKNGLGGYLYHFAGQPKDAIGWGSAILLFPLELMGELIKPVSLACRLFGNILGEDILLAVFVGLGVLALSFINSPVGLPLQLPFYFLSALFGMIQGLVFALLTTVYIVMMLPHDDHHGPHEDHAGGPAHAAAHT